MLVQSSREVMIEDAITEPGKICKRMLEQSQGSYDRGC